MKYFLISIFLACSSYSFCQDKLQNYPMEKMNMQAACTPDLVFTFAEKMPEYKGGYLQLENDLRKNINFDKKLKEKFYVKILINCKGESVGFEILKGKLEESTLLINELKKLQNWTSAMQNNQKVDCFTVINFDIRKGEIFITNR